MAMMTAAVAIPNLFDRLDCHLLQGSETVYMGDSSGDVTTLDFRSGKPGNLPPPPPKHTHTR